MKIALVNHSEAGKWGGGDGVQVNETAKWLMHKGHEVSVQNSDRPEVDNVDIVHIFNSRVHGSFKAQVSTCLSKGKKFVVTPIWIPIGKAIWGSRGCYSVLSRINIDDNDKIQENLDKIRDRNFRVILKEGWLEGDGKGTYPLDWLNEISSLINKSDGIIANSWLELKSVRDDLKCDSMNVAVANYGVDANLYCSVKEKAFRDLTGIKGKFVLQVGRIEPGKNQATLCWALKDTGIPIVLIGKTKHWPAYAKLCKEIYGDKLYIIDHMDRKMVASAYKAAKLHCLISWMETCGLVSMEAAVSGTAIIGSTFGHELEYIRNDATCINPADVRKMKKCIIESYESECDNQRVESLKRLRERILTDYTWEKSGLATEKMYKEIIETA